MSESIGDRFIEARKQGFAMGLSLGRAIQAAGGAIPDESKLAEMTIEDFVAAIAAQNGIRFSFVEPAMALDGNTKGNLCDRAR